MPMSHQLGLGILPTLSLHELAHAATVDPPVDALLCLEDTVSMEPSAMPGSHSAATTLPLGSGLIQMSCLEVSTLKSLTLHADQLWLPADCQLLQGY